MALEVPDLSTAHQFIVGAVDRYTTCFGDFDPLQHVAATVGSTSSPYVSMVMAASASLPSQVMSVVSLVLGGALWVFGYKLVRPVNFCAGAYLGSTLSLLLLKILAPTLTSCAVIVPVGTASGLLLGVLCALKRSAVLVVLGIVTGEIIGDLFYKTFLSAVAPEYIAFGCIGFFSVLVGVLFGHVGDFAWKLGCAFFGAYMMIASTMKLVLIPFVPNGYKFEDFLTFQPDIRQAASQTGDYASTIFGSPYMYGPTLLLLALTVVGTSLQVKLLKMARTASDQERLIAK